MKLFNRHVTPTHANHAVPNPARQQGGLARRSPSLRRLTPALLLAFSLSAQTSVSVTELTPNVLVFATNNGNVVASVGPDGAFLVGTPSADSTQQISDFIAKRTKGTFRYVVIGPQDLAHTQGDAGWVQRGAFVAMHENALGRLGGHGMGTTRPLPQHLQDLGVDRPRIAFSEVITFDINGDAVHVIHQSAAFSDADSIVHFHAGNVLYFGDVFPGDGYPEIDPQQGGKLDGIVKILSGWTNDKVQIVPARGKVLKGADVKAYCDMITSVRTRIQHLIDDGKTEAEIVATHPTSEFDGRWGNGRIKPDQFVHEVFTALKPKQ